jgi:hypothetical protein
LKNKKGIHINMRILLSITFIASFVFTACETDIDVNAPNKDIAVVYGLMNVDTNIQVFKINRMFQTTGDANQAAKERALHEYENLEAFLVEVNSSTRFKLEEFEVTNKEQEGAFYAPNQTLYRVNMERNPDKASEYRLEIKTSEGRDVKSTSTLVYFQEDFNTGFADIGRLLQTGLNFVGASNTIQDQIRVNISQPFYARSFEFYIDFHYTDVFQDDSRSERKTITFRTGTYFFGNVINPNNPIGVSFPVRFNAFNFYDRISKEVPDISSKPNIKRREPEAKLTLRIVYAHDELTTYMEVTQPSGSLLEDKPPFTNVENGIGIFSARMNRSLDVALTRQSFDELTNGVITQLTGTKGFCNPLAPVGTSGSCF